MYKYIEKPLNVGQGRISKKTTRITRSEKPPVGRQYPTCLRVTFFKFLPTSTEILRNYRVVGIFELLDLG